MRRFLGVIAVLALILAGVVVGGAYVFDDRIRAFTADRVAGELQRNVPFTTRPRVTIDGHPFALHLVTREFPRVQVQARQMPVQADQATTIPLYDVDVTLTDVRYEPDAVHADTLAGGGWLDYADLSAVAGTRITRADETRLSFERDVEFMGRAFTGRLLGRPSLDPDAQTISLAEPELDLAGVAIPDGASQALVDAIIRPIAVQLPYGIKLDGLTPADQGLQITVDASGVTFPSS